MDIIGPTPVQLYNVHPTSPTQGVQDAVQHNLLLHQMIQATVLESTGRQVLLDLGQQKFKAQTDVEMQTGQKLNLEVVATEPRLKLQVVSPTTDNQLLRLIHLYDHRTEIGSSLKNLLGQRFSAAASGQSQPAVQSMGGGLNTASGVQSQNGPTLSSMSPAQNPGVQGPTSPGPMANTPLPTASVTTAAMPQAPVAQSGTNPTTVSSDIPPATQNTNAQAAAQIPSTPSPETPQPQMSTGNATSGVTQVVEPQNESVKAAQAPVDAKPVVSDDTAYIAQNRQVRDEIPVSLAPPSPQQVAGMTTLLHRLDSSSTVANALFTAINLVPLSAQQKKVVEGALTPEQWTQLESLAQELGSDLKASGARILFNLSHNLGLDYELLLSQQKSDQAAETLKGALMSLAENDDVPESVRENSRQMSQQLELLQLTRARFAQEGILFLPLPFEFMEQGYALVEQRSSGREGEGVSHVVTLNMSLEGLGAVQANVLFEQQALFVRILCEDEESQAALEENLTELEDALAPFSLRSIQVALGAEDPAVELINRLQPHHDNVFDARV
nr:flagellar hook-length control protein FliK [uncultured Desulfuromonas sp.]